MDERYPLGSFIERPFSLSQKEEWITSIQILPTELESAVLNLDSGQLATPYREGGWTVQQVVHHVADSHMNAYIRFKLGLTEEKPHVKPYKEELWAGLADNRVPVNVSLTLLHALHIRLAELIKSIKDEDFDREVFHPEHKKVMNLWYLLGMYAWHGKHHVAHINMLRSKMNWD